MKLLPADSGVSYEDTKWLLKRVKEWDENTLHIAKQRNVKPSMGLAIAVGKAMLKRRDGSGTLILPGGIGGN